MNANLQHQKEQEAKEKFESGTGAFTYELFSDAVRLYKESGTIYREIGMKDQAFMAFYQAVMARSREYPEFLKRGSKDFLRPEYLRELEELVTNFSEFEENKGQYKERYLKIKYVYLKAKSFKFHEENDFESEAKGLLELASFVEAYKDIFPEERYQVENVFKWRMGAEQAKVNLLRERGESLESCAEEYKRIAVMNEPPAGSTLPFLEEVRAQQANFHATSLKFSAFSKLQKRRPAISDVKAAMECMEQALDQAKKAKAWFGQVDKEKGSSYAENLRYLSYWYNIFLLRVSVHDKDFIKAEEALSAALADASYYRDLKREDDIFPNYYADYNDLKNENLIILALKVLVIDSDTQKSSWYLKQWLDLSKDKHLGSWRYNNVYIRYLVVSILALLPSLKEHLQDCNNKVGMIDEILRHGFVGSASRKLVTIAKDMIKFVDGDIIEVNDNLYSALFCKICDFFPIASTSLDFRIIEAHRELWDPFEFLPEYFSNCFKKPENLKRLSLDKMQKMYQDLMTGLVYYLSIITEFHYKRYLSFKQQGAPMLVTLPNGFDCNFSQMDVGTLKIVLGEICKALNKEGRRFQKFQIAFSDVEDLLQHSNRTVTTETLEKSFQVILEKIIPKTYMSFFPHVVQFTESYTIEGAMVHKVRRVWKRGIPEELNLLGPEVPEVLEKGAYYYLTPRWKRYGRESVDTRSSQFAIFKSDLYSIIGSPSSLKQRLSNCPIGQPGWRDYEDICIEILKFLFVPPLGSPRVQSKTEGGLLKRDALFYNYGEQGFWSLIDRRHGAQFILSEFKNTENLEPTDVDQVAKYLILGKDAIGKFGIILSREPPPDSALKTRKAWFTSNANVVILFLYDELVTKALELKEKGDDPVKVLQFEYETFLASYEP